MVSNRAPGAALVTESAPEPAVDVLHGRPVPDPYRWLESADSPRTLRWLEERGREYAAEALTWPLRDRLAGLIRSLVDTDLWSPPVHRPGAVFATVRPAGGEHPRLVVLSGDGPPRTVYDPVAEDPAGHTTLDAWEPSPDGGMVAVQTSSGGVERGALRVIDAGSGEPVGPAVPGVRYSHVAWAPRGVPAFYYVRRDGARGVRGVWLRRVLDGTETLVHACTAPGTVPGVRVLGNRWLLVSESHGTGHRTDLWLADLAGPAAPAGPADPDGPTGQADLPERPPLRPVQVGEEAETEARLGPDGLLYLRTTLGAPWRRICAVSPEEPGVGHWREVVPEEDGATLDAFAPCPAGPGGGTALFVARTRLGISSAAVHDTRTGGLLYTVDLPGEGMVSTPEAAPDGSVYLAYADVATQQRVLCLAPGERTPRPWPPGAAEAPPSPAVERSVVWCRSADGTRVPVTVFTAAGRDHTAPGTGLIPEPTLLHAYGGFGRPRQFGFSATVLAWLLSGGRYAVAHVRGGGDAGRDWHLAGSGRDKPRAVEDLVAAAAALVGSGMCTREQLCLSGGSAGGLLVLAAATARPDLCGAVIASAPLADMARFERMGLGRMWTREFGTAADPDDFAALMSYSPYHRALEGAGDGPGRRFPSVLLTGFHGDTRTDAAHPRKMCAALLAAAAREEGRPPVLLRYERDVGHGPRAVSRAVGLAADAHAFAAHRTGLSPR
ncbi:prolyl oligopeptidase family serine peptidase [Nocardiopsis dassonvillei]|uniref:prolyl oligopeptidase family serine peptidase n=1 Tax=Nocardiopsis dassonvillei TaxID=2014 RepID=UPI00102BB481|nr:prolyl oligopeptidase family serine peptidase [Nocardiopsis dassonvillei]MCP3011851.1 prolyl oligopeptidase family serine peptidase [Nocardiopsis dassonvillei]